MIGLPDGYGPLSECKSGLYYHGREEDGQHRFAVVRKPFDGDANKHIVHFIDWDPRACTAVDSRVCCGNCSRLDVRHGCDVYICLGHELLGHKASMAKGPGYTSGSVDAVPAGASSSSSSGSRGSADPPRGRACLRKRHA